MPPREEQDETGPSKETELDPKPDESDFFTADYQLPACYHVNKPLPPVSSFPDCVLFYIFYNLPNERQQLDAAIELEQRGWAYVEEDEIWVTRTSDGFWRFNPATWKQEPLK